MLLGKFLLLKTAKYYTPNPGSHLVTLVLPNKETLVCNRSISQNFDFSNIEFRHLAFHLLDSV